METPLPKLGDESTPHSKSMKKIEQPRIETKRLILEPYRDQDVEDIFAYASNPEVTRLLTWQAHQTLLNKPVS